MSKYRYREVKNGIIIYGVLHELVETKRNDCSKCSLYPDVVLWSVELADTLIEKLRGK